LSTLAQLSHTDRYSFYASFSPVPLSVAKRQQPHLSPMLIKFHHHRLLVLLVLTVRRSDRSETTASRLALPFPQIPALPPQPGLEVLKRPAYSRLFRRGGAALPLEQTG